LRLPRATNRYTVSRVRIPGATLTEDLWLYGNPVVELQHTADNPHVDLFVWVSEVDARGRSRNVSDGYRRLNPAEGMAVIELDATAHRFRAGSRIRVLVTGSWFPTRATWVPPNRC
jgi:uncharacterized protein